MQDNGFMIRKKDMACNFILIIGGILASGDKIGDMDLERCTIIVDKGMKDFLSMIKEMQQDIHMMRTATCYLRRYTNQARSYVDLESTIYQNRKNDKSYTKTNYQK